MKKELKSYNSKIYGNWFLIYFKLNKYNRGE